MRSFALIASLAVFAAAQEADNSIFDMEEPTFTTDDIIEDSPIEMNVDVDMNTDWKDEDMEQVGDALAMAKDLMDIFCGEMDHENHDDMHHEDHMDEDHMDHMDGDHWDGDAEENWEGDADAEAGPGRRLQEDMMTTMDMPEGEMVGTDESSWTPEWAMDEKMDDKDMDWGMGMNANMTMDSMMDMDDLCMQARSLWNEANNYHHADDEGKKMMEDAWSSMIEMEIKAWFDSAAAVSASAAVVVAVATLAF